MNKVVRLGRGEYGNVFCRIKYNDKKLSITGVEGPMQSGNAGGRAGQILNSIDINRYAKGWDEQKVKKFVEVWGRWHLNDLNAECEHQRALGWTWETHPSEPCPVCGYKLGAGWKFEPVPKDVINYLKSLPETDINPTWV